MSETIIYSVPGISSGHCREAIAAEVTAVDGIESVTIDLDAKLVRVTGQGLDDATLVGAIDAAGYEARRRPMKVCIVGASGKLGRYMVRHALDRGYEVVAVCRPQSVPKLDEFAGRIEIFPGATDDRDVIRKAVAGCDGVLVVLVPWGMHHYASGTAQAVLDFAEPEARVVFSCGWHITRDGTDRYSLRLRTFVKVFGILGRVTRVADLNDQVEATNRIFASDRRWTVVRGSDLEEGESQGLPVWSRHVGDPVLASNLTRRIDFALFMVDALTNDELIQEAPAIAAQARSDVVVSSPQRT